MNDYLCFMIVIKYILHYIYVTIIYIRNLLYDIKILKSKEYDIPIICIGNLSVGGTGKTPHVEYIVRLLNNKKISILSRGYGRISKGLINVKYNSSFLDAGDEPLQIKQKFPDCNVICCENRRKGIEYILKKIPETEVIIMDDGFQHRSVKAGLNILLNNYNNPIYLDRMMPLGTLREHTSSIKRADIIITTNYNNLLENREMIIKKLNLSSFQKVFFSFVKHKKIISSSTKEKINITDNINIILVTSIADTTELIHYLNKQNLNINHLRFNDHHRYNKKNIDYILKRFDSFKSTKNIILTTEKDEVKLNYFKEKFRKINLSIIPIEIIIEDKQRFDNHIIRYVENHKRNN